ncbi:hypothetical protein V8E36_003321 [Tilletia maclaganii]
MLQLTLGLSALSGLVLAVLALYPYYQLVSFHFPAPPPKAASPPPPLFPHLCEHIPELAHCDDIAVHKASGHAYFTCDDTRLWRDPLRLHFENDHPTSRKGGAIWHLDLNDPFSIPTKLDITRAPRSSGKSNFHPAGITLTTTNSSQHNSSSPDAILLLVSNYPKPNQAGVVDVLVHDLGADTLRHHRRLDGSHFHANWRGSTPTGGRSGPEARVEDRDAGAQLSPWRLSVFLEQYSPPLPPDEEGSGPDLSIPSFFFSSAPLPPQSAPRTQDVAALPAFPFAHLARPRPADYITNLLLPSSSHDPARAHRNALRPPAHVYTYLANGVGSVPTSEGSVAVSLGALGSAGPSSRALAGFPPIPRAWDGGGARAGKNNSAAYLFVLGSTGSRSTVAEHEQHWVRAVGTVIRIWGQQALYSAAKRLHFGGDAAVARWGSRDVVGVYTPQYVSFSSQGFAHVQTALANDVLGRFWTAGPLGGFDAARTWLEHLYNVSSGWSSAEAEARRPQTAVYQVTHLYRHGPSVAHPWELDRLKLPREEGLFLPKEFYSTPIFRSSSLPAGVLDKLGHFEPISVQPAPSVGGAAAGANRGGRREMKRLGFVPTLPTGLEVDHKRGWVLISSVWDERGAARCEIPKKWAEK